MNREEESSVVAYNLTRITQLSSGSSETQWTDRKRESKREEKGE